MPIPTRVAGFAVTPQGRTLLARLPEVTVLPLTPDFATAIAQAWTQYDALVFCLALGAVTRAIAPLLQSKATDPAVVVLDEAGTFAIPLCGGHLGGAERLARSYAAILGATPVLTSASERMHLPGVDLLGEPFGWRRGAGDWTGVAATIARGEDLAVYRASGTTLWQQPWQAALGARLVMVDATMGEGLETVADGAGARVWIGDRPCPLPADCPTVSWHPRTLWIGIGCERGTSQHVLNTAIRQTLTAANLVPEAIAGLATISLKMDEAGLLALSQAQDWPLYAFTADDLRVVDVPNPSPEVAAAVGTPSVAEAAALLAAGGALVVPKQVVRLPGEPGAATIAIARREEELTGRNGQLSLVGIGPGNLEQLTPAAKRALVEADAIVGYGVYVDLVQSLLPPGQIVETYPITQERQRASRAVDLAEWGLTVAVLSSGDCGIYGMAGLVFEELRDRGWDGDVPAVEVFPGITALQAAAARVGAPLMHDFCAISLSDLLTPLLLIEQRLEAAARADFVTAFYNPRSASRTAPLDRALAIFRQHRDRDTPVALVRAAYRSDESIQLTTLERVEPRYVDMFTTVLIGNSRTRFYAHRMMTPRAWPGLEEV